MQTTHVRQSRLWTKFGAGRRCESCAVGRRCGSALLRIRMQTTHVRQSRLASKFAVGRRCEFCFVCVGKYGVNADPSLDSLTKQEYSVLEYKIAYIYAVHISSVSPCKAVYKPKYADLRTVPLTISADVTNERILAELSNLFEALNNLT